MLRALLVASLVLVGSHAASGQDIGILHITAVLVDAAGMATPVPGHALLISDEPPGAPPRRIRTAFDGTASVRLRPGAYTVESDQPVVFDGQAYHWTQHVVIVAAGDAVLELTIDNAAIDADASTTASAAPPTDDPAFLMPRWQDSVVAIWTPSTHASGFLIDGKGLIATNQRAIGSLSVDTTAIVEVQLSPDVKVAARVLVGDPERDVAILWIDPTVVASSRSVPLGCGPTAQPPVLGPREELFTIGAPLRGAKRLTYLTTERRVPSGSAGGPVFTAGGDVVGLTTTVDAGVVPVDAVCEAVAIAETRMQDREPPSGTPRPVDPVRPFPVDALEDAVTRRAGSLNPYQMSTSDFDIAFLTPVLVSGREYDFGNWSEYMADVPPVLSIRVTPKMVESFWTTVGRAAARTQGVALPPITHVKAGLSRMRVFCGEAEVTPIHPFTLEQRVSDDEAVHEGLYVLDPGALGPQCGAVTLVLYSEKEPEKGDTRGVDPRVLERIWQDFAPYRN